MDLLCCGLDLFANRSATKRRSSSSSSSLRSFGLARTLDSGLLRKVRVIHAVGIAVAIHLTADRCW